MCGNLVLSKLCSIFQAFLVVLQTLCSESKPADSGLAFLTPLFMLLCCSCIQTRGWKPLLAPVYPPRAATPPRDTARGQTKHGPWGCSTKPARLHAKHTWKTKQKIVLVIPYFCFCSPPRPSPPIFGSKAGRAAAKVHTGGVELPPAHFLDGWIWMVLLVCPPKVKAQQIHHQVTPNLLLCPHTFSFATLLWTRGAYFYWRRLVQ